MTVARGTWTLTLVGVIALGGVAGACGSGPSDYEPNEGLPNDAGNLDEGGDFVDDGGSEALVIEPADAVIDVSDPSATVKFTAKIEGTDREVPAVWSVERAAFGLISKDGTFKPSAQAGGVTRIYANYNRHAGSTSLSIRLHIRENPAGIDDATQAKLKGGGSSDWDFRWLYPYDQTVFPRGLAAPIMQFGGEDIDAAYVKIQSEWLDYEGFFGPSSPARVDIGDDRWRTVTLTAGASDPVRVEVTKMSGGAVTGPIEQTWHIAQGTLRGTVYYNTYDSQLAGNTGAIMRVKIGQEAEVLVGGCTVCHAVSADGSTLVSAVENGPSASASFNLLDDTKIIRAQSDQSFTFAAPYPDGTMAMSHGAKNLMVPGTGLFVSRLYDTKTGSIIPAPGWDDTINYASMPAFSPDGRRIVFNHEESGNGHTLAVMDFNKGLREFSNLVEVAYDPQYYLGWPAFTPDAEWVLYHADTASDFATWSNAKADLVITDVATQTQTYLDVLNGFRDGVSYLPYETDPNQNYEPTLLPVAVGGYYWVVFTSRRHYGNIIPPQSTITSKKLWVAAIDINPTPGQDPSHPAFYLPGQEVASGNMRGFWAMDPCKENGNTCEAGDECCTGFCRQTNDNSGKPIYQCVSPPGGCSEEYEKCETASDCCGAEAGFRCINGHCASPPPK